MLIIAIHAEGEAEAADATNPFARECKLFLQIADISFIIFHLFLIIFLKVTKNVKKIFKTFGNLFLVLIIKILKNSLRNEICLGTIMYLENEICLGTIIFSVNEVIREKLPF